MKITWIQKKAEMSQVGDKLGHPIDKGILDLVTSLNFLGIHTSASCEGHLNWATGGPYIDIDSPKNELLHHKFQKFWKIKKKNNKEIDKIAKEAKKLNTKEVSKLLPYLEKFYKTRLTPFDQKLVISAYGWSAGRLESQGVSWLDAASKDKRRSKLRSYQKEMKAFGDFLKRMSHG
jgi:hypothetical protein